MNLCKPNDCLRHDLMVARSIGLEAYRLAKESLQLITDDLSHRKQKTKIASAYSDRPN